MQLIPLKFLRLRKFLGGRGTVAQLTSTSRVTRLFQFYVSFRTDAGSVLPYVCDKRGYPPVDVVRLSRSLNRRCPGLYCVFYGNLVCRSVSHGRRREKKFFFIFFWAYEWVWDAESRWLYCTSLWVECTWDVASCSGANSVVSLACICFSVGVSVCTGSCKDCEVRSLTRTTYIFIKDTSFWKVHHFFCHQQTLEFSLCTIH